MKAFARDIERFFASPWVVGALLTLALFGLIVALSHSQILPPTLFFAGVWYTRFFWLFLGLSLGMLLVRGLRTAADLIGERGVGWAIYRFLTSIRLAIVLISLLVLIGLLSTLVPQLSFNRRIDLITRYGPENFALLQSLGFFTIFNAWYTYAIVALFVLNLSACTFKRLQASLHYVRLPMHPKNPEVLRHMPCYHELGFSVDLFSSIRDVVRQALRSRGFRVREARGQLLAEKWRWERLSIDVFHVSLLMAIGALAITNTIGYDYLQVNYKGDVFSVPGHSFQVRVDDFWSENYPDTDRVMDWKTRLTVLEDGKELKTGITEVNHPFTYRGVSIYQAAMGEDWLGGAQVTIRVERADGTTLGEYQARVNESFTIPDEYVTVKIGKFLPDFALSNGVAYSRSQRLLNPAVYLEIRQKEQPLFSTWAFALLPEIQRMFNNPYRFYLEGMTAPQFTGLEISWDPGLPVAYGAFVLMISMLLVHLCFQHQMIWVHIDEESKRLRLGGRSRKGDFTPIFNSVIAKIQEGPPERDRTPPEREPVYAGQKEEFKA